MAPVSPRHGGSRFSVYGSAATYLVTSCPFAENDADAFCPATGTFPIVQRKSFGRGGRCKEEAFSQKGLPAPCVPSIFPDSWRNNRGDKSGITRDEPGHTGKTLCNFIAWDENRRGGKSLPFSSLLDGVRVWPESLFRLSTHHGSGSVGGVLPHLGKPTVGPLAVVFFHR